MLRRQSRERVLQTPHLLLLNFGSFRIQILCSKGREHESTSVRSFVRRCISFGSRFHPGHPNISMPCCSLAPEGRLQCLPGGGKPTHYKHLPACLQPSPQTRTVLFPLCSLMAAFITIKDISGLFLNCSLRRER